MFNAYRTPATKNRLSADSIHEFDCIMFIVMLRTPCGKCNTFVPSEDKSQTQKPFEIVPKSEDESSDNLIWSTVQLPTGINYYTVLYNSYK